MRAIHRSEKLKTWRNAIWKMRMATNARQYGVFPAHFVGYASSADKVSTVTRKVYSVVDKNKCLHNRQCNIENRSGLASDCDPPYFVRRTVEPNRNRNQDNPPQGYSFHTQRKQIFESSSSGRMALLCYGRNPFLVSGSTTVNSTRRHYL